MNKADNITRIEIQLEKYENVEISWLEFAWRKYGKKLIQIYSSNNYRISFTIKGKGIPRVHCMTIEKRGAAEDSDDCDDIIEDLTIEL